MKQLRKLISAVTALAMTAAMFAGLSINASAAQVYIDENFDSYESGVIIASVGSDVPAEPDPVTNGMLTYRAGRRTNAATINCSVSAVGETDKYIAISEDDFSTSERGIAIDFAEAAGIPAYTAIASGEQLKLSFDISATNTFTVAGWGEITTTDLTASGEEVNVSIYTDNDSKMQTLVVKQGGEIANVKTQNLSGTALTGMSFYHGTGVYNIDNLVVETVADDVAPLTVTVKDESGNNIAEADVKIGSYTMQTGADGTAVVYLPAGSYSVSAEKNAYTGTDNSTKTVEMSGTDNAVELVITEHSYDPVPTKVSFASSPAYVGTGASSEAFTLTVLDQEEIEMTDGYTVDWAVYPSGTTEADPNVTIDNGVVTVAEAYASDSEISEFDVVATVGKEGTETAVEAKATIAVGNSYVLTYDTHEYVMNGRSYTYTLDPIIRITDDTKISFDFNPGSASQIESNGHSTVYFRASNGTAFGLQYAHSAGTLAVFTAASMSNEANASGDCGAYTVGDVVASVAVNTVYHIEISVIGEKLVVGVSSGDEEPTYTTIDIDDYSKFAKIEYVRIGNYRTASGLSISNLVTSTNVTVDPDMIDIEGAEKIAKVKGEIIKETYTAAPLVPVEGETFTWAISDENVALTPSADTKTAELVVDENTTPGTYTITVTSSASAEKTATYDVVVGGYSYIVTDAEGASTVVDTSGLDDNEAITGYLVTTAANDGTMVAQTTVDAADSVTVDSTGADKVEIAPVYEYDNVGNIARGYDLGSAFADAAYNFEFTKTTTERSDILVNGLVVGNNVCQDAPGRTMTDTDRTYKINDIKVDGGSIVVSAVDCVSGHDATAFSFDYIKAVKAPSIVNRVPKVWVTGDSLVATYYGTPSEYIGTSRSGWGQMLENFITDDYEVINLGNSGATTQSLYDTVYPTLLTQAQEGDLVVFESGYNDQGKTTPEAMKALVVEMAEGIKATGADLVYVTPNASRHDLKESVKYAGNLIAGAEASDTPYIDLSKLSYKFHYSMYGTTTAESDAVLIGANYNEDGTLADASVTNISAGEDFDMYMADRIFVWTGFDGEGAMCPVNYTTTMDTETVGNSYGLDVGDPNDGGLHSSYLGAMKYAEIVAQGLANLGFDGIDKTFTWSTEDSLGNTITVQVK